MSDPVNGTVGAVVGWFKNPLMTLVIALALIFGNWWRNSERLDALETEITQKQSKETSNERYQQLLDRLKRIEEKIDRLAEKRH